MEALYEVLDDPTTSARFSEIHDATHAFCTFTVPAIHCASCVGLLERLNRFDARINGSVVDLTRKTVRVGFNPRQATVRSVAELLASLNFPPLLSEPTPASTRHRSREILLRLGVAGFAASNVMLFSIAGYLAGPGGLPSSIDGVFSILSIMLALPVMLYSASPWWKSAWGSLRNRTVNLDVPVALGIAVIFVRSIVDITTGAGYGYLDSATALVFFLLIGRLVQEKAFAAISFDRTVRSFFPLGVRVVRNGVDVTMPIERIAIGDIIVLRNGEVLPCNATLQSPTGYLDYSFVTGERAPHECTAGNQLMAGGKVVGTSIRCMVVSDVSHGHLASLWERTSARRPRTRLLDVSARFGAVFTLVSVLIAVTAFAVWLPDVAMATTVLTAVLIIACPCAMTLAAPIALGTAMGLLGRRGIMVRSTGTLLELDTVSHVVFDKTGTLTSPEYSVAYRGDNLSPAQCDALAAVVAESTHPVSRALSATFGKSSVQAWNVRETVGGGVYGKAGEHTVAVGSRCWVKMYTTSSGVDRIDTNDTLVCIDGRVMGHIVMDSILRDGVTTMIADISSTYSTSMITGDGERDKTVLEQSFRNEDMHFGMLPDDKVDAITAVQAKGKRVLMVGDGLNDAAAMNTANVAIAVANNTATIVPACDVIVPGTMMTSIPSLLRYAGSLRRLIIGTFAVSMVYNAIGLTLAVTGALSPVAVAILMPISSLTVIGLAVGGAHVAMRREQWK